MKDWQSLYRRDIWSKLDDRVEVWAEKETLTGVLIEITYKLAVPLNPCRGYASYSFLRNAAEEINNEGKDVYIYYFGDADPSGENIFETIKRDLRKHTYYDIEFKKLAVTEQQIKDMNLPTRPTKKMDGRAKKFGNRESVEVEAVPPAVLRELCEEAILAHIPEGHLDAIEAAEQSEKNGLMQVARQLEKEARQ